jgi:hypothetical protein
MKKTYATPSVAMSGEVVRETKGIRFGGPDGLGPVQATGSVGFYL